LFLACLLLWPGRARIANPGGLSGRLRECFIRKHSPKRSTPAEDHATLV